MIGVKAGFGIPECGIFLPVLDRQVYRHALRHSHRLAPLYEKTRPDADPAALFLAILNNKNHQRVVQRALYSLPPMSDVFAASPRVPAAPDCSAERLAVRSL